MKRLFWIGLGLLCFTRLHALEVPPGWPAVQIDTGFISKLLMSEVGVFQTTKGDSLSLQEVQMLPDSAFRPALSPNFLFGLSESDYWIKVNLVNSDPQRRHLFLEVANPTLQKVIAYQFWGAHLLQADTTGIDLPFSKRPHPHQNFLFPIDLPAGDSISLLVFLGASYQPMNFNLYLWDRDARVTKQAVRESFSLGSFFLLHLLFLSMLAITSLGFGIRELWYYTAYVLFGALFVFADLGLGYRYVWGAAPYIQKVAPFLLVNLYTLFGTQFIRKFFRTQKRFPGLDRLFLISMGAISALLIVSLFHTALPLPLVHGLSVAQYLIYLVCSISFVTLFIRTMRLRNQSGWFLLGFSLHGAGIFLTILQYLRLLPKFSASAWFYEIGWPVTFSTQTTLMAGMILEIPVMLYIAFSRFKYLERQNSRQAIRLAELREKSMNDLLMGIESERRRLAQDLHDGLSVNLAAIKMKANLMEVKSQGADQKAWREIMEDLETAYEELRRISHNLPPKSLFKIGLGGALDEIVQRARTLRPEMKIHYYHNLPLLRLSKQAEVHLYRIILELLNNALKHSEASSLSIQIMEHDDQIVLTMEDNGKGYNPEKPGGDGIGLSNIKSRVAVLGGTLSIDSRPGKGAVHIITFPSNTLYSSETD
ncbi:MAG: hypothetical protein IPH04_17860 [Saprospirales bacterium]|nr:hypothetical protein [Saprospirales bacterium]